MTLRVNLNSRSHWRVEVEDDKVDEFEFDAALALKSNFLSKVHEY